MNPAYDLAVFDLAGTTVFDEGDVVAHALRSALIDEAQLETTIEQINRVMGIAKPLAIASLLRDAERIADQPDPADQAQAAALVARIHQRFVRGMIDHYRQSPSVCEMPGATQTFQRLRSNGIKVALNTGFSRDITDTILNRLGWSERIVIDASITSDEVPEGRPAPFMIHRLMERLGVNDVRRVVKIGDTPSDLHEGTRAGCGRVVGVTNGSHTREQLLKHPHTDLIPGVSHLPETLLRHPIPKLRLHTPGPANTTPSVRSAMTRDIGAWDRELIDLCKDIRHSILEVAGVSEADFACVLMQGSGTFAIEAAISTAIPRGGRLLVVRNGAYGERIATITRRLGIDLIDLPSPETEPTDIEKVLGAIGDHPEITHLAVVHCETTTGVMNDIAALLQRVRAIRPDIVTLVDAMSSFGAETIDMESGLIDWLIASSNKCLQGTPGIGFVVARIARLTECAGRARGLSLDLHDQWLAARTHGRFRYTPPTHVLLALNEALTELKAETPAARLERYRGLRDRLIQGMNARGFNALIQPEHRSAIITTFLNPTDRPFDFDVFYQRLQNEGFVIYPGKISKVDCFRVGHLGDLQIPDIDDLLAAIDRVMATTTDPNRSDPNSTSIAKKPQRDAVIEVHIPNPKAGERSVPSHPLPTDSFVKV